MVNNFDLNADVLKIQKHFNSLFRCHLIGISKESCVSTQIHSCATAANQC